MLGHKLYQQLGSHYEVYGTLRGSAANYQKYGIYDPESLFPHLDISDYDGVIRVISEVKPHVVINCIGVIKQLKTAKDPIVTLKINSLWPHQLANLCQAAGARMFHISTDCVFSGSKGMYTEEDVSDAKDLYGRTKFLGEVNREGALTLRTSIIGRELATASGLVEWFLSNQNGHVKGFKKAIYTGFTTIELSKIIMNLIEHFPNLSGLYQVSSDPIDKYTLLNLVNQAFGLNIKIEPDEQFCIDRSLDGSRFRKTCNFTPPSWQSMISEMANDTTSYERWHSQFSS